MQLQQNPPGTQAPAIGVARITRDGDFDYLTPKEVARDEIASTALRHVKAFDAFLRQYGRNGWDDAGGELNIELRGDAPDNAGFSQAMGGVMELGRPVHYFRRHPARAPEIIGHELAHGVLGSTNVARLVEESVADVLGVVFSRTAGHSKAGDWTVGRDTVTRRGAALGAARDLAQPDLPTISAAIDAVNGADHVMDVERYATGGFIGRAAALGEDALGPVENSRIWASALIDRLPKVLPSHSVSAPRFDPDADWRPRVVAGVTSSANAIARATIDAAGDLGQSQVDAIREAWRQVGVEVDDAGPGVAG